MSGVVETLAAAMCSVAHNGKSNWATERASVRLEFMEKAELAIKAARAAGWALVPVEPTEAMLRAGAEPLAHEIAGEMWIDTRQSAACYAAMIAAALAEG